VLLLTLATFSTNPTIGCENLHNLNQGFPVYGVSGLRGKGGQWWHTKPLSLDDLKLKSLILTSKKSVNFEQMRKKI
jgi:hypothetical protein